MTNKTDIFRCPQCGPQQIEFERHNIYAVDEYNRPINMRSKTELICALCKSKAVLYKTDPEKAKREEAERQALGQIEKEFENKTIVTEEGDSLNNRHKPIVFKGYL